VKGDKRPQSPSKKKLVGVELKYNIQYCRFDFCQSRQYLQNLHFCLDISSSQIVGECNAEKICALLSRFIYANFKRHCHENSEP
jgi:hypothetical protein